MPSTAGLIIASEVIKDIIKTYSTKMRKITDSKYDEQIDQLEHNKKMQIIEATTDSE